MAMYLMLVSHLYAEKREWRLLNVAAKANGATGVIGT